MNHGLLIILSSPSGAGKTTVCRRVLEEDTHLSLSVSATTRLPRPEEKEGVDYFFLSPETFHLWILEGAFLEYAPVLGNWYGTLQKTVQGQLEEGKDLIFDVDWQGGRAISQKAPEHTVRIFLLPPSLQELERRLKGRGQDSQEVVEKRMAKAHQEINHWAEYDYVLVNEKIDQTVKNVQSIIQAERLKRKRQKGLFNWVRSLEASSPLGAPGPDNILKKTP
ncbi:MAG: guanylate kinase [Holosporales bacterium]|jgi:guanylate kinase